MASSKRRLPVRTSTFWKCAPDWPWPDAHTGCYGAYDAWDVSKIREGLSPPHYRDVCDCECHTATSDQPTLFDSPGDLT